MARLGTGIGRRRGVRASGVAPPPSPPAGFAPNGSANPALKAMLARVRARAGRGRVVFKGDSTTVGEGAGAGGSRTNARVASPPVKLAELLRAVGVPASAESFVGDAGIAAVTGQSSLSAFNSYDPRVGLDNITFVGDLIYAGGGLLGPSPGRTAIVDFAPTAPVDTFELVGYNTTPNGAAQLRIDEAPLGGPGTLTALTTSTPGATRFIVKAGNVGFHYLRYTSNQGTEVNIRSIVAYDSTTPAVDVVSHAACGQEAAQADNTGSGYGAGDALLFDAPDLTIINYGLNELNNARPVGAYTAALQSLIAKAKRSGDVLLVFPHPAGGGFGTNQAAFRDAAASLAASEGVAFLSLYDYFGGAFTPAVAARMSDGVAHGNAGFYAEVADVYRRCILAMAD